MHDINFHTGHTFSEIVTLLKTRRYIYADYFQLQTTSEYWSGANLLIFSKSLASTALEAIVFLTQKMVIEECKKENDELVDINDLFHSMIQIFAKGDITTVDIKTAGKELKSILDGMHTNGGMRITKNGESVSLEVVYDLIITSSLVAATSLINEWNEKRIFIETHDHWLYFEWATGA